MSKCVPRIVLGASLALILATVSAQAQATRTWVSGVGDDANPCSRTAPCKTFAGAISKTAAAGIINCIDPGGFGAVTITKSITIDCEGTFGGILASGTNGVNVNAAGIIVNLRNLSIEGVGTGLIGVNFINGAALNIENCNIFGFKSGTAVGINFSVPTAVTAELSVANSTVSDNGTAVTNGGILIKATGTGVARAVLNRVMVLNNSNGIRVDGTGGTVESSVQIRDTVSANNTNNGLLGINGITTTFVDRSSLTNNGTNGVQADGANTFIILGNSFITKNATGYSAVNSGRLQSYNNNAVNGNGVNGTPLAPANILSLN